MERLLKSTQEDETILTVRLELDKIKTKRYGIGRLCFFGLTVKSYSIKCMLKAIGLNLTKAL